MIKEGKFPPGVVLSERGDDRIEQGGPFNLDFAFSDQGYEIRQAPLDSIDKPPVKPSK